MALTAHSNNKSFQQLIEDKKLVICVGAGGVGKHQWPPQLVCEPLAMEKKYWC